MALTLSIAKLEMNFIGSAKFEEVGDLLLNSVGTVEQFRVYLINPATLTWIFG